MITRVWNIGRTQFFGVAAMNGTNNSWNSVIVDSDNNVVYSTNNVPDRKSALHRMRAAASRIRNSR
jgi:hypothetical protein